MIAFVRDPHEVVTEAEQVHDLGGAGKKGDDAHESL